MSGKRGLPKARCAQARQGLCAHRANGGRQKPIAIADDVVDSVLAIAEALKTVEVEVKGTRIVERRPLATVRILHDHRRGHVFLARPPRHGMPTLPPPYNVSPDATIRNELRAKRDNNAEAPIRASPKSITGLSCRIGVLIKHQHRNAQSAVNTQSPP